MPLSSVIIPVFNNSSLTSQCLDALKSCSESDLEVIVVDDASTDDTAALFASHQSWLRVITHKTNQGFSASCNDGAANARGKFLVFLNNDTIPSPGWLNALVDYAKSNPTAGVIGAKLLYPNNTIQHAGMVICAKRHPVHIYKGFPSDHPAVNKSRPYPAVTGACMLVRRDLFEQVNGFNTSYKNGYEDVDICLRLHQAGHETHYCHKSELYHLESSTRDLKSPDEARNLQLYYHRWGNKILQDDFRYYIDDGLLQLDYTPLSPIQIRCEPMLATLSTSETDMSQTDHLLHCRMQQVHGLLQENLHLLVHYRELKKAMTHNGQPKKRDRPPHLMPEPEMAKDGVNIQDRLLESVKMENDLFKAKLEQSTAKLVSLLESSPDQSALVETLQNREAELRKMLIHLHEQLVQRDEMIILGNISRFQDVFEELWTFLDELDQAVESLYSSRRWAWANFATRLVRFRSKPEAPRGYWRIDDILKAYRTWREMHVAPLLGRRNQKKA